MNSTPTTVPAMPPTNAPITLLFSTDGQHITIAADSPDRTLVQLRLDKANAVLMRSKLDAFLDLIHP